MMKTPWHLWVIGVVSLLWNLMGAYDYLMTQMGNEAYLSMFTPEQLDYINSFPAWSVAAWALGVWFSVIGSALLLWRSRYALTAFLISLIGVVGTNLYTYVLAPTSMPGQEGSGAPIFSAVIAVVALGLAYYASRMIRAGVLR